MRGSCRAAARASCSSTTATGSRERAATILARRRLFRPVVPRRRRRGLGGAGFELFSGVNVPSKAFGEFVEHTSDTPSISASELDALMRAGADMVVLDSRPFDEYRRVSIPTATNVPGAELVLRVHDLAPSPDTLVVVNCAGRTRSIIGAQSLINAGVPNKVVALRNGTMGWHLAGLRLRQRQGQARALQLSGDGLAWAKAAAERVAQRFGIERIDQATLERWRADDSAHALPLRRARSGRIRRLAMCRARSRRRADNSCRRPTNTPARSARASCSSTTPRVRAVMTASWLQQMGWKDVFVLAERGDEARAARRCRSSAAPPPESCRSTARSSPSS